MDAGGRNNGWKSGEGLPPNVSAAFASQISNGCFEEDTRDTYGGSLGGREEEIPRGFALPDYIKTTLKSAFRYPETPEDNITQDNYHFSSSKVCREGVLSPDNALSLFPSRHKGNAQELVDYGKYSGSSLTASGDQKSHDQAAAVSHSWVSTGQHCHKLPELLDSAPVVDENVGAELVKDMDWNHKPTGHMKAEIQPNHNVISPVEQQQIHGRLAIRPVLKLGLPHSHCRFDGSPHANLTKGITKRYDDRTNNSKTLERARDEMSIAGIQYSRLLLDAWPSSALSTELAAPSILTTPIDEVSSHLGIGGWASDGKFPNPEPPFAACLDVLPFPSNDKRQSTFTQCGSKSNGSNSGKSESRLSQDANRIGQNGKPGKRRRLLEGGANGEGTNDENDENDDGDDSTQRTPDKSATEYTKKGLLACPFYKNDPAYFTADLFHDGKYFLCASRGFPDIARLKEHIYRKHSLPHTCSRCGDVFKTKPALDNHLPVRSPEKITCEVRVLPLSKTKGLTPDMERELRNRSKNGAGPTMEDVWIDIYKKLFPGTHMPSSGPYLTDSHGSSWCIEEREEYIQYSEQELPGLVKEKLDATRGVSLEQRDLLVSVLKSCQKKLPGMFLQAKEASRAPLTSENGSPGSMSQSNELVGETIPTLRPSVQGSFQPDSENANSGSNPSISASQFSGISTLPPDTHTLGHIPSPDSCHDSGHDSLSRESDIIYDYSHIESNRVVPQSSSLDLALEDFGFDMFALPTFGNFDLSTMEFDCSWSDPAQKTNSDVEKCSSRENRE